MPVTEGDLTLRVAQLLAPRLRALGADVVAVARPLLPAAIDSAEAATAWLQRFIDGLRICLHGCGAADLRALRGVGVTPI